MQVPAITVAGLKPRQITKVGVIGGGLMGCIATALIIGVIHVVLKEINVDYLHKGIKRIEGSFFHPSIFSNLCVEIMPM